MPDTPPADFRALMRYNLSDHAILRRCWHNFAQVAPGVFRSNHPTDARFAAYADQGIRTVINLRGESRSPGYLYEQAACARHGMTLVSLKLYARAAPGKRNLAELFEAFDRMERPALLHCKSGADRAGLASALYLLAHEGASVAEARKQLSLRFLHIRQSPTGILDRFLDAYKARLARGPIGIETWCATEYDPAILDAAWRGKWTWR